MYDGVEESCGQSALLTKRPSPAPRRSNRELIAMAMTGERRGLDIETEMLREWRAHRDLLPRAPSQSRFSRQLAAEVKVLCRAISNGPASVPARQG
jgi:hypothetical protein